MFRASDNLARFFLNLAILFAILFHGLQVVWPTSAVVVALVALLWTTRPGSWASFRAKVREPHAVVLGAAIILLPCYGAHAVMALLVTFLFVERRSLRKEWLMPLLPIAVIALGWIVTELWCERTLQTGWYVLSQPGGLGIMGRVSGLCAWLRTNTTGPILAIDWLIRISMIMALAAVLAEQPRTAAAVRSGLILGLTGAIPVALWQIYGLYAGSGISTAMPAPGAFWAPLRRISATFSDPNAFGVACVVLLPLMFEHSRQCSQRLRIFIRAVVLVCVGLVFFSGSRAGALGLMLVGAFALVRRRYAALAGGILLVLFVCLLNLSPATQAFFVSPTMPESIRRVANGMVLSNAAQTLFSRGLFLEISTRLLASNLWVGIGLERYRDFVVPLSFGREGVLPLWTDNSNNFYLGITVELGLLGVLCGLGVGVLFRMRQLSSRLMRVTLGSFLLLLLFGPHIEFPEVAALSAILLALTVEPRPRTKYLGLLIAGAIGLLPAIALKGYFGQYGFHGWEQDGSRYFRWTGVRAQGWVRCVAQATSTELLIRAPQASVSSPVEVAVAPLGLPGETLTVANDAIQSILVPCPNQPQELFVPYRVSIKRPYFPWGRKLSGDARVFGVQVIANDPSATVPF